MKPTKKAKVAETDRYKSIAQDKAIQYAELNNGAKMALESIQSRRDL